MIRDGEAGKKRKREGGKVWVEGALERRKRADRKEIMIMIIIVLLYTGTE